MENVQELEKIEELKQNVLPNETAELKQNDSYSSLSIFFFLVAVIFVAIGFYVMYHYGDGTIDKQGHIVGGDAYNFIIIAVRGLGYIVTGLIFTVLGSTFYKRNS